MFTGRIIEGVYCIFVRPKQRPSTLNVTVPDNGNQSTDLQNVDLWHLRFAHANIPSIRKLAASDAVTGLNSKTVKTLKGSCDSCVKGKQTRVPLHVNKHRTEEKGAVIHSDVCGPMPVPSLGGSLYFVCFIDEYSGYIAVYPIKKKSDVAEQFRLISGLV